MIEGDPRITELEERLLKKEDELEKLRQENESLKNSNLDLQEEIYQFKGLVYTSTSLITFLKGPDYIVEFANEPIKEVWGKGDNVEGKSLLEVLPELRTQGIKDYLDQVFYQGEPFHARSLPVEHDKNGEMIKHYFDFSYMPQYNADKEIIGIGIIAQDVTDRIKTEIELKESEHRYKDLIHSSNSLIAILRGPDMVIEIANDAIKKVWGKGPDVEGRSLFDVLPEIVDQGMPEIFRNVYETGEAFFAQESPIMHLKDGEMILGYFDFIYQALKDSNGEIEGVSIIASEVTNQALLNKQIKKSEREFRELVNFMPHKISLSDAEGNPVFYNQSWLNFVGKTFEEFLGQSYLDMLHPEEREDIEKEVERCLSTGENLDVEVQIRDKDGNYIWHLSKATPIKDEEGNITSWISSSTEIQKLKEDEKRQEDFLKLVSHELKTPVTSIKGYIQLLLSLLPEDMGDTEKRLPIKPYLNRIETQVERLIRLLSEMLDLSRIEQNELDLKIEKFNLNSHIMEILEDLKYSNKNVELELEQDLNCDVHADRDRIGQVVINFVTNALKYSPDSNRVKLRIYEPEKDHVSVSVEDFGIGINEKEQNQIFKRFYRISGNNDDTYEGFGIGLYLSNEIIERHNGKIYVKSELGKGSEFTFTIPLNHQKQNG
ncbi:PAS domain-containing protein [Gramella sp. MT6]|uniref:PAS domain-containing sensor histidine kinase n=1 Tax=Gramella sp. MT6 TaxID=2705471 RepID=UPI001C5E72B7|nr:PAS domain-containing sensor histidine kinase [Gramella sp. MT6]QYA26417.1 PAS domain-containing protein [Gramella sp. MT6]